MGIRIREESGFGLLELLIAMVVLNVGLFAVVGVFNGATVAMGRASTISAATAVADKQMEDLPEPPELRDLARQVADAGLGEPVRAQHAELQRDERLRAADFPTGAP